MIVISALIPVCASTSSSSHGDRRSAVSDHVIKKQRNMLAKNTNGKGFGPHSPRDIDSSAGSNKRAFNSSPAYEAINLCNIHFHKNTEHKGGEST